MFLKRKKVLRRPILTPPNEENVTLFLKASLSKPLFPFGFDSELTIYEKTNAQRGDKEKVMENSITFLLFFFEPFPKYTEQMNKWEWESVQVNQVDQNSHITFPFLHHN